MTLQEAKDKIAKRSNYKSWAAVPHGLLCDELAKLYARAKWDEACEYYENNTPILPARKPEFKP